MKFLSVCSGIEAASVAWAPLGWSAVAVAEIEPFPGAVLAHHYPGVPNFGDLTRWQDWPADILRAADVLVGGTPCQSFSVAGLRRGMSDDRGNLALQFLELANAIDHLRRDAGLPAVWVVWENVPGVLSDAGNAFGAILGGMVGSDAAVEPPRGRGWSRAGVVSGPARCAAWRCLDAQHFGVAQRRDRVFVVARGGAGDWSAPDALLPVTESVRWHPAPRREAGERVARPVAACPAGGSGYRNDADTAENLSAGTLGAGHGNVRADEAWTGRLVSCPAISPALKARDSKGPSSDGDGDGAPLVAFKASHYTRGKDGAPSSLAPPLSADADKGDQDTLVCAFDPQSGGDARGLDPRPLAQLQRCQVPAVFGFSAKDSGADASSLAPTLRSGNHDRSHANGGVMPAVAFDTTQVTSRANRSNAKPGDPCHPLAAGAHAPAIAFDLRGREGGAMPEGPHDTANIRAADGGSSRSYVAHPMAVRRLTPRECERLQGFPDDYTLVPYRGKPAADGPRYRALGNSMAVPVMRYIGARIQAVTAATNDTGASAA